MKIEFLDQYRIWDLKKIDQIRETIFNGLPSTTSLELDVRGCAFDYLSAPILIQIAVDHMKKIAGADSVDLTILFEEMTTPEVSSEFFGAIVKERDDTPNLDELIQNWAIENNIRIHLLSETGATTSIIKQYGSSR